MLWIRLALPEIKNKHSLIASTNAANVSRQKFTEQIDKGFAGRKYQVLQKYGLPADFVYNEKDESSNYLKVITMKVSK